MNRRPALRPTRLVTVLAAAFVCSALSTPAQAADHWFNYDGNICSVTSGSPTQAIQKNEYGVNNQSNAAELSVICPVPLNNGDYVLKGLRIGVYDRHTTRDFVCGLWAVDPINGARVFQTGAASSGGGAGTGFQLHPSPSINVSMGSPLQLVCSIPRIQTPGHVSHLQFFSILVSDP